MQQDVIVVIPPLCIKCIMMKSRGRELSCVFDAILQLVEIKSLSRFDSWCFNGGAQLVSANQVMGNHKGSVLKIA